MNSWIWPIRQENWPTVKKEKVWAVTKKGKGSKVKKGDEIIFYLNQTMFFTGIYKVVSDWHEPTIIWPDEAETSPAASEIDLEVVQLGFASVHKLLPDLKFIENKSSPKLVGLALRAMPHGPANSGKPIPEDDYNLIRKELKNEQKEPDFKKSQDDQYWLRKQQDLDSLSKFLDEVPRIQLEVLNEISRIKGRTLNAEKLGWSSDGPGFLNSKRVSGPYLLHPLGRGTYTPAGSKYAQSIFLSPETKWGKEISRDEKTLKINYDYGDSAETNYKTDIKAMTACKDIGLPIGVFFKLKESKYRCLGLGRIISNDKNNFVIVSDDMTDEDSKKIKDNVLNDYHRYYERAHREEAFINHHPVNWDELGTELEPLEEIKQNASSLDTTKKDLDKIIYEVTEGNWVLPDFQRTFEWDKDAVRDLLESVLRGYYIGTILLWNVSNDETRNKCFTFPIEGVDEKSRNFTKIILDGQQRITSLNYAINPPEKGENHPGYFYIDLQGYIKDDEEHIVVANKKELQDIDTFDRLLFPFKYLEKHREWTKPFKKFLKDQGSWSDQFDIITDTVDDIVEKIKKFDISTIELDVEHSVVVNIFEKVNTTGKRLNVFDLMNNRLTVKGINLTRDLLPATKKEFQKIEEYNKAMTTTNIAQYIMESISLSYSESKSCKRPDILEMYDKGEKNLKWTPEKFTQMWNAAAKFLNEAIKKLENTDTGFGLPNANELPYEPMLPVLASLIQQTVENFENENKCDNKIRRWYWASLFSQRYSQGVQGKKTADYKSIIQWFKNDADAPKFITDFEKNYQTQIPFEDITKKSSGVYRGVMCLIKKKGATDPLIVYDQTKKEHMDHIFPKSKMKKYKDLRNSILNMTWLTSITNITKSDEMPKEYYTKIRKKHYDDNDSKLRKVLSSHLINNEAYDYLLENEFEEFLEARRKEILKTIANEMGIEYVDQDALPTQTSKDTDFTNVRILRNRVESCKDELSWVDKYFTIKDFDILQDGTVSCNVKEIKILLAKQNADQKMKSDFRRFKNEMKKTRGIKCKMRVMNKEISAEIHDRYLICPNQSYNIVSGDTARRGQVGDISECARPDIERWWESSYDIFDDWNKFQD